MILTKYFYLLHACRDTELRSVSAGNKATFFIFIFFIFYFMGTVYTIDHLKLKGHQKLEI